MARPKKVAIKLTPKQREALRKLTGTDHGEVLFEAVESRGRVAAKASLARKTPLSGKGMDAGQDSYEYVPDGHPPGNIVGPGK